MRHAKGFLWVLGLSVALGACSDSTGPDPALNIGTWIGTYGSGASSTGFDYTLIFFAGDSMRAIDGLPPFDPAADAVGTWTQVGDTISGSYTYAQGSSFAFRGVLSASTGAVGTALTGTWGSAPATSGGGGFSVAKQ